MSFQHGSHLLDGGWMDLMWNNYNKHFVIFDKLLTEKPSGGFTLSSMVKETPNPQSILLVKIKFLDPPKELL